jgi:hypothetical protein
MKEFSTTFNEGLRKGLRASKNNPRNSQGLVECFNLKPSEGRLEGYEPITNPFTGVVADWPFPQVFIGQDVRVLATATQIYELSNWTLGSAKLTVSEDERWDFIDFGSYLILTNGTKLCIRDHAGAWTSNDSTNTIPRFSTGCNFNGQVVGGNIRSSWYNCGSGSIIWSKIGSVDFTPDGTNEAGFRNIPWEGDVLRIKKLGKAVIVYSENGIGAMLPFSQTFGWRNLMGKGILSKAAVAGDEKSHLFVDTDYMVWLLSADLTLKFLGYQEFMESLTQADVVIEHDSLQDEFHISDEDTGYVMTQQGMGECYQKVTTVAATDGVSYGVSKNASDSGARIVSDTLDFGLRGIKTIQTLEIGTYHPTGSLAAHIKWRSDKSTVFADAPSIPVAPNGVATVTTSGVDLRIGLTYSAYSGIELDYIIPRVKITDKRAVRGLYNVT